MLVKLAPDVVKMSASLLYRIVVRLRRLAVAAEPVALVIKLAFRLEIRF